MYYMAKTYRDIRGGISEAHLACSGSQSEHRIRFFSPARRFSHIINSSFSRKKNAKQQQLVAQTTTSLKWS